MNKTYFYLSILSVSIVSQVNASIIHTDIDPDSTSTMDATSMSDFNICTIDFNNDGVKEFDFRWDEFSNMGMGWFFHMTPDGTNAEYILKGTQMNAFGARYIEPLAQNVTIDAAANWGTDDYPEPLIGDDADPNFQDLGDRYVGVRFDLNGNTHYGWVLVSFDSNRTLTIKEYAYEDQPNTPINAGQTSSGSTASIVEESVEKMPFYPNPVNDFLTIENSSSWSAVQLYNLNGKLVLNSVLAPGQKEIDLSEYQPGNYVLVLSSKDQSKLVRSSVVIL